MKLMRDLIKKVTSLEGSYNRYTLRFMDHDLQRKFHEANAEAFLRNGRIALIVSISIFILFSFTDYFIINDIFWRALILRLSIGLFLGIGSFILSYLNSFDRFGEQVIGLTVLISGLSILYMIIVSESDLKAYYFFGFYIVVLVSNVFFRQSFILCLIASFLYSISFEYTVYVTLGRSSLSILNHWYFYSVLIMLLVNSYSSELHRLYEFLLRRQVEKQNKSLTNTNMQLDHLVSKKTKELQVAYQNEKKANLLQQTFLMNISHQIRTPLNSIIGLSDSNQKDKFTSCDAKDLRQINNSGRDLLRMIDEIVLYSKIEAESVVIHKTTFNIGSLFLKVAKYFDEINKRDIKLNIDFPDDKGYYIQSDYEKLLTILQNLILDAYNRSNEGSLGLSFSLIGTQNVLFKIIDSGSPLKEDYISDMQSGKWLEENKVVHSEKFGISLINKLCSYFGNGINISTNNLRGNITSFDVATPVEMRIITKENTISKKGSNLLNVKVLVVEDIDINYTIIKRILERQGALIDRAVDGLEALSQVAENSYSVILMDIRMPKMSGIEATKKIRAQGIHTPIIAQTANILAEDKYICIEAGCNDYIGKPINALELIEVVEKNI